MTIIVAQIIFLCILSYKLINLKLIHSQVHRPELTGILSHFSICLCHCETNYYGQSNNNSQPHSQLAHQRCAKVLTWLRCLYFQKNCWGLLCPGDYLSLSRISGETYVGSQDFLVLLHPVTLISILRVHVSLIDAPGDVDRDGGCVSTV
jgi:hypothetical protein